jgi:hypothetical protein
LDINTNALIISSEYNRKLILNNDKCDRYDYLAAIGCGAIGGIIDIFFVGSPKDGKLTKFTDKQVDNMVMKFAKMTGWKPKQDKENSIASAIGFLEKKFKVNYDQRHTVDVGGIFDMNTKNHHMKSLAHAPDIVGLFFSILNQFTSTATFIADGKLITIKTDTFELQGGNFLAKIFCGIANWFGHIMSDIAGTSGGRGKSGRGSGVVIPFYELFALCKFGKFSVGKDKQDLATIATRTFQEGYDFRHGLAMAIPVIITDLSIRLIWSLRRYFQYEKSINDCISTEKKHSDLRVMLLFGNGTLCTIDGIDAGIRSGGNALTLFLHLNLIAWFRFSTLVLKEICIRTGLAFSLEKELEAFKRINEAYKYYLRELEEIDIERFKKETEEYSKTVKLISNAISDEELNIILIKIYDDLKIEKPWKGDFDEFIADKNERLVFK